VKACAVCGAQNRDDDSVCGVCGAKFVAAKTVHAGSLRKNLIVYLTGPSVVFLGIFWLWVVDGLVGILVLSLGLLITWEVCPGGRTIRLFLAGGRFDG